MTLLVPIIKRIAQAILTALGASVIVWALLPLAPGDPATRILMSRGIDEPNQMQIEELRSQLALDRPLPLQYVEWLGRAVRGDLSVSYKSGRPVLQELGQRAPATFTLLGAALVISVTASLVLALVSARYYNQWPDRLIMGYTQLGAAVPTFILALLVLHYVIVGAGLGKVLSGGALAAVLWPALTVGLDRAAGWTQLLRANLLENLESSHVLVARARGASQGRALLRYALPNSILPFLTAIGVSVGALIGGAPIIEEIFTWPGIGRYVLQALSARDFPVVQGFVLISGLCYAAASLLVDLLGMALDPRIRGEA
jgi:ABC-type dipeptide/oligopeptide/nickel transport system permease component